MIRASKAGGHDRSVSAYHTFSCWKLLVQVMTAFRVKFERYRSLLSVMTCRENVGHRLLVRVMAASSMQLERYRSQIAVTSSRKTGGQKMLK